MASKLKNLYNYLIENRKHENRLKKWHVNYCKLYEEVEQMRQRIKGGKDLSKTDDKDFLQELLQKDNGITSRGQSILSHKNFQAFIENNDFISALQQFILNSNKENFWKFHDAWMDTAKRLGAKKNPLLVNRVATACTLKVSTIADASRFNEVFNWLIDEKIIPAYPREEHQDWFPKNIFLMEKIKAEFSDELEHKKTDKFYLSLFVWELYENQSNPFSLKKQLVKYGAPGTGKTYQARQQAKLRFDIWKEEFAPDSDLIHETQIEQVQFHPSYSYEDFIEGLRPVLDGNGTAQLRLQNGVFKEFCLNAGKWEIDVYNLGLDLDWESIKIDELIKKPEDGKKKLSGAHWRYIFEKSDSDQLVSDAVPPFFFIIDEVNRAELSRVFGELMYCLEYRGAKGRIKTQYANLNNDETGMLKITDQGWQFFIPTNVHLICTMNTIDRSVESFDFALRRRFHWEEVAPNVELLRHHLNQYHKDWVSLADNLEKLNEQIGKQPLLGGDYQIGHAYLMNLKYDDAPSLAVDEVRKRVWEDSIRPLLQEYLRGTGKEAELIEYFKKEFGI